MKKEFNSLKNCCKPAFVEYFFGNPKNILQIQNFLNAIMGNALQDKIERMIIARDIITNANNNLGTPCVTYLCKTIKHQYFKLLLAAYDGYSYFNRQLKIRVAMEEGRDNPQIFSFDGNNKIHVLVLTDYDFINCGLSGYVHYCYTNLQNCSILNDDTEKHFLICNQLHMPAIISDEGREWLDLFTNVNILNCHNKHYNNEDVEYCKNAFSTFCLDESIFNQSNYDYPNSENDFDLAEQFSFNDSSIFDEENPSQVLSFCKKTWDEVIRIKYFKDSDSTKEK
ncbi:MAG: hypothetical protein MJ060_03395 [Clostridia bacterium]|nr:hypothetical protein [Clostridia bacterium]